MPARSTPETPRRQADDSKRHRDHFRWLEGIIAATNMSPAVRLLAVRLALHRNVKNGRCFVGYATLAAEVGIAPRSAMRAVAELERRGWLTVDRGGGRGHANEFGFLIPAETVTGVSQFPAEKGDRPRTQRVAGDARKSDRPRQETVTRESPQYEEQHVGDAHASPNMQRESDVLAHVEASGGAGSPCGARAEEGKQGHAFEELEAVWRRPWPDDPEAARDAFVTACREVAPDVILESARAWVAAADAPRFLLPLAKWLNGRCFEHEPPGRKGPPRHAPNGHRRHKAPGAKPDLARMMLEAGRA